jgi:PKD repeat protein
MDGSTDNVVEWLWEFEGGTPSVSIEQNPTVLYDQPGSYMVSLKVTNAVGDNSLTLLDYISIGNAPQSDFSFNATEGIVEFTNLSSNADTYEWYFGDDNVSTEQNPVHEFTESGMFDVMLIATNEFCSDTMIIEVNIVVSSIENVLERHEYILMPNPHSDYFMIRALNGVNGPVQIELLDMLGKSILKATWNVNPGDAEYLIQTDDLSSGQYIVRLIDHSGMQSFKVIKSK